MAPLIKDILPMILHKDDWRIALAMRWNEVVGSLQTRIRLEKIQDDTAVIGVYESHWMQELFLLSSVLCDSMNACIGEQRIKRVRFILIEEKKYKPKKVHSIPKTKQQPSIVLTEHQEHMLRTITDDELKHVLISFWARCSLFKSQGK